MEVKCSKLLGAIYCIVLIPALVSCNGSGNVFQADVSFPKAEHEYSISGVKQNITENIGLSSIYIYDSLLIAKTSAAACEKQFVVYSTSGMSCLGKYVAKGRGANELLRPIGKGAIRVKETGNGFYVFDLNQNTSFVWDVNASVQDSVLDMRMLCRFRGAVLDAMPCCDSLHLVKEYSEDGLSYKVINDKHEYVREYSVYTDVSGIGFYDKLSSADVASSSEYHSLAMAMCFLPQINIIDMKSGTKRTLAVDRKYRDWAKVLNRENMDLDVYYLSACPLAEYLVALYCGEPMQDWLHGNYKPHLHVFSWSGKLVCDIALDESLKSIAVDERCRVVYGLDAEDNIYRYDLSELGL